jgi:hypothetical protein
MVPEPVASNTFSDLEHAERIARDLAEWSKSPEIRWMEVDAA